MAAGAVMAASCLTMAEALSVRAASARCEETCAVTAAGLTAGAAETAVVLAAAHARSAAANKVLTVLVLRLNKKTS